MKDQWNVITCILLYCVIEPAYSIYCLMLDTDLNEMSSEVWEGMMKLTEDHVQLY